MAISTTYNKKQEELAKNQSAVSSNKEYSGMAGVSRNTANNLGNYQQGYQQSQQVQAANDYLNQIQAQKPQTYNSKYGEQLNALLQQIQNPKDFKYDFNGDELFKSYADLYTQKGKQAAMDVQGQAAGLTGGYGNSYGQQVGQQQYQQYLLSLYDKGLDLRDRAYQAYQDQLAGAKDAYGLTAQAEATDYGRYQDQVANWQAEREYAANRADTEYNRDYNQYQQNLQYWTGLAQIENAAYNTEAERQEAIRQYEQNFAENQRQYNTSLAEQQRQYNTSLAEQQRQYDASMAENQRQFDASMAQSAEQFEKTTRYNYDKLAQDQAQFDANLTEQQRQYNTNKAVDYVSAILANGLIPSNELLIAAGLSYEDAMKLIAQVTGGTGGKNSSGDDDGGKDIDFYTANQKATKYALDNLDNLKLSDLNPSLKTNETIGGLKSRVGTEPVGALATIQAQQSSNANKTAFDKYKENINDMLKKKINNK